MTSFTDLGGSLAALTAAADELASVGSQVRIEKRLITHSDTASA